MAHYALMNQNNVVLQVITGRNEDEVVDGITDWEAHYAEVTGLKCKRTSYNTNSGRHALGGTPYRITFAAIGLVYDENLDGFIHQQPFPSWILDTTTGSWSAPTPSPDNDLPYTWNEKTLSWEL